ncbi:MAG: CoA-transferase [Chloroflexota bacterium]|nr:CoA-transferase [Chloroflexota bacterium]MDP6507481.1 CoA-transferase [Chloroflexota bacterium]MDP6757963.1 CoA-transferase [Chloroflexota bacterium]
MAWTSDGIAARVAAEIASESVVSIGIGMPARIADHVDLKGPVMLHMENGVLGLGPRETANKAAPDVSNATGTPVAVRDDAAFFDIDLAVRMMRGGHIDVAVLGAMEVAHNGDLAGWRVPGAVDSGMGGAMDLVVGARRVIVCMSHTSNDGAAKLVPYCRLPLTGRGVVDMVVTGLGVFAVRDGAFHLTELADEVEWDEVAAATAGNLVDARDDAPAPAPAEPDEESEELLAAAEPDGDRDDDDPYHDSPAGDHHPD